MAPAWALAALPLAPLLLGALVHMAWLRRGVPLAMVATPHPSPLTLPQHVRRLVKATDRYYKNEHRETAATSRASSKRAGRD